MKKDTGGFFMKDLLNNKKFIAVLLFEIFATCVGIMFVLNTTQSRHTVEIIDVRKEAMVNTIKVQSSPKQAVKIVEGPAEPVEKPVVEPLAEPIVEPVPKTVAEPTVEPVSEPVIEEPEVEPVVETPAVQLIGTRVPIPTYPEASPEEKAMINNILAVTINDRMSDFEVAIAINNYLCATCTYDDSYSNYSAYSILTTGTGVCQAYANAYWRLMNAAGIQTDYVSGYSNTGGSHGWNRCLINGQYYYVDVTWNDSTNNWGKYLLISYDEISRDHIETKINRKREY